MIIELHMIQNFAPSNLNRDDTGAPKDCDFGGVRRARISSQCLKRAMREEFKNRLLPRDVLAIRTKVIAKQTIKELVSAGKEKKDATKVTLLALKTGLKPKKEVKIDSEGESSVIINIPSQTLAEFKRIVKEKWDELLSEKLSDDAVQQLEAAFDNLRAADLALFGRMLAEAPQRNIDAASQVAHAISTHKVAMEFDFYTAVDDLQPREETGAGMMGTIEFNSACFYRYANVDVDQLKTNLGGDEGLARRTIEAFLHASKDAIPTGKQNSFAAHNPPAFILAVVREKGTPVSLANAFEKPVPTGRDGGLVEPSIEALDRYWRDFTAIYGNNGIKAIAASRMGDKPELKSLQATSGFHLVSFDKLVESLIGALEFAREVQS
jgi:CRISPR system Cascade subunit CasC